MALASTAYKLVRTLSAVGAAEAAPTTTSAWVTVDEHGHFSRAKVAFTKPTLGGTVTSASLQVWVKQGSVIVPVGAAVSLTNGLFPELDLGAVASGSFYVTLNAVAGTAPTVTVSAYVYMYNQNNAV